jgi:tetrathionate reductase subunit B
MSVINLPAPSVDPGTCAVGPVASDGCRACIETCPYGAIDLRQHPEGAEIRIDPQLCQRCGACSGVCPTSSIERPYVPPEELVTTILGRAATADGSVLAITCPDSQAKVEAAVGADNVVVTPSLLIVDETYLLTAIGAGFTGVLLVGCLRCTHDEPRILMDPLSVTRAIVDDPRRVAYVEDDQSGRLHDAITQVAGLPTPRAVLDDAARSELQAATDRRARLRALLPAFGDGSTVPMAANGFGAVTVDGAACIACGACAIACPTDTLQLDASIASLSVTDLDCVACGSCVAACPDDAISLSGAVPIGAAAARPRTLLTDESVSCRSCGTAYAPQRLLAHARQVLEAADLDPDDPRFQLGVCPACRNPEARQVPAGEVRDRPDGDCACGGDCHDDTPVMDDGATTVGAMLPMAGQGGSGCGDGGSCACTSATTAEPERSGCSDGGGCACSPPGPTGTSTPVDVIGAHTGTAPAAGEAPSLIGRRSFVRGAATVAAMGAILPLLRGMPAAAAENGPVIVPGRMGMVIDLDRCIGCHACTNACKAENNVPLGKFRDWVEEHVLGEYPDARPVFLPKLCNHCDDPGCLRACPTGAIFKRVDGIVDLDPDICIACQACMQGCPYGMTFYNHQRGTADKCNLCTHRIDEGLDPACVEVCPSQCRIVGDFDDPESPVSEYLRSRDSDVLREDYGLGPNVRYVGLPGELDR